MYPLTQRNVASFFSYLLLITYVFYFFILFPGLSSIPLLSSSIPLSSPLRFHQNIADHFFDLNHKDRIISFLPMSHVAAQLFDIHVPIYLGINLENFENLSAHTFFLLLWIFLSFKSCSFFFEIRPYITSLLPFLSMAPLPLDLSSFSFSLPPLCSALLFNSFSGCAVYFCQPDALKGSLTVTMREVRPTLFFSVPRVWEKIQEKMVQMGRQTTGVKKVTLFISTPLYQSA